MSAKLIIAYIVNLLVVGGGFALYGKSLIGLVYLLVFVVVYSFHEEIGAIWAILVIIVSYVHLYRVIAESKRPAE